MSDETLNPDFRNIDRIKETIERLKAEIASRKQEDRIEKARKKSDQLQAVKIRRRRKK